MSWDFMHYGDYSDVIVHISLTLLCGNWYHNSHVHVVTCECLTLELSLSFGFRAVVAAAIPK